MEPDNTGARDGAEMDALEPDLDRARRAALTAHDVVIRLKEMGLPEELDEELAGLSTDLGDLWGAQQAFVQQLQALLESGSDWRSVGDKLIDLRATVDHIRVHATGVREPMTKVAEYAYGQGEPPNID